MKKLKFTDRFNIPDYFDPRELITSQLEFSDKDCIRCGICVTICPGRSIALDKSGKKGKKGPLPYLVEIVPDISGCIGCGCCAAACPQQAISVKNCFAPTKFYTHLHQLEDLAFPKRY